MRTVDNCRAGVFRALIDDNIIIKLKPVSIMAMSCSSASGSCRLCRALIAAAESENRLIKLLKFFKQALFL